MMSVFQSSEHSIDTYLTCEKVMPAVGRNNQLGSLTSRAGLSTPCSLQLGMLSPGGMIWERKGLLFST